MKVPSYMISSYVGRRVITPSQRDVLFHAFSQRMNIIVCGNLGVGKTTFLNAIANELHHMGGTCCTGAKF
ncbi:Type II/IV secretion system protein [Selenomonas ruminantium]|uniref:Type II/IV secretion system protein n=1 Tax=Selenomonas ruminantium TaxID=971 RepID=A0A1H3YIF8_SELRU|nr:Type II/IV secretion system protein [Selenomonas ruminantium]